VKNDGGLAFPLQAGEWSGKQEGLSKREYYAGQAMMANRIAFGQNATSDMIARVSKADSDALIAELEKE